MKEENNRKETIQVFLMTRKKFLLALKFSAEKIMPLDPAMVTLCTVIKARYDAILDQSEHAHPCDHLSEQLFY